MTRKYILEKVTSHTHWYQHPFSIFYLDSQKRDSNLSSLLLISFLCYALYFVFKKYLSKSIHNISLLKSILFGWFTWTLFSCLYHLNSIEWTLNFLQMTLLQEQGLQDLPSWGSSLIYGIFGCVLRYEIGIRILLLFPSLTPCVPRMYQGSLDGEFIWATLVYSFSMYELLPFCILKYISLTVNSIYIMVHLISYSAFPGTNNRLAKAFAKWSLLIFWCRRIFAFWSLIFGSGLPWLLWFPDALVITTALLFDVSNRPNTLTKSVKRHSRESAYSPSSPSIPQGVSSVQEREWYKEFLFGDYSEDELNDFPWSPTLNSIDSTDSIDHLEPLEPLDSLDSLDNDRDISSSEVNLLLKEAMSQEAFMDDSYLCPDRVYTRQMRSSLSQRKNSILFKTSSAWKTVSHRIQHFKSAISNPSSAMSQMVDSVLESRRRLRDGNQSSLICVVCRDAIRDTILMPCRHLSICHDCKEIMEDKDLDSCPICFKEIQGSIKIYWS